MTDSAPDGLALRRRRVRYRSWRRGMKETDLVLGRFADAHVDGMSGDELEQLESLIACPDIDILGWVVGSVEVPAGIDLRLIELMRNFNKNK